MRVMSEIKSSNTKQGFLAAFQYSNFRFLWASSLGMNISVSIEMVVIGWLILELTDSPFMVGLVAAIRMIGMGFGPFFGTIVDRFDRRRVLMIVRVAASSLTLVMAVLHYTSLLEVWHIFVVYLCLGIIRAFNFTANNAIAPDTVGSRNLTSAIGMLFVGLMTMSMVGPLIGGYLLEKVGAGACFIALSISYLSACLLLFPLQLAPKRTPVSRESVLKSMKDGFVYMMNDRAIFITILLAALANISVAPIISSIMPVFAREILHVGASGLGWLVAAYGLGGLVGSVITSSLGEFKYKGWLQISTLIAWSIFMAVFANLHLFSISLVVLVVAGISRAIFFSLNELLLLIFSSEEARGRVMGIRALCIVMGLLGSILLGSGAGLWGAGTIILISALSCLFVTVLIALWASRLRRHY